MSISRMYEDHKEECKHSRKKPMPFEQFADGIGHIYERQIHNLRGHLSFVETVLEKSLEVAA